jgi:hypothetical protein
MIIFSLARTMSVKDRDELSTLDFLVCFQMNKPRTVNAKTTKHAWAIIHGREGHFRHIAIKL